MTEKKKVLLVVRWPVGGIRTFLRYVYNRFDSEEWHFTIVAPKLDEMNILLSEDLIEQNVCYISLPTNPTIYAFAAQVFIELFRNRYDMVHSHGFSSGVFTAIPARLVGVKHMMTSHDIINANQFRGIKGKIKKKCLAFLFKQIDVIHSVSHDAQTNLLEHFHGLARKPKKCIVIPNGIEVERFLSAEPRDLRAELGIDDHYFLIGFLGRFMSQKGFRFLIDAVAMLKSQANLSTRPLVLTFGDGGYAERDKREIRRRGLESYFHFMPFSPNIASTLKGLDVVVMPSLWEACPLLPMEALVCGTPLITTNCIGLREVVFGTPTKVVDIEGAKQIADAIIDEIETSSKNAFYDFRQTASNAFDVQKTREGINSIYDKMVFGAQ